MAFNRDEPSDTTIADFALMEAEPGALERYWRLAVDTSLYQRRLKATGLLASPIWIDIDRADSFAKFVIPNVAPEHRYEVLVLRWESWAREYDQIAKASPKWRLKDMIGAVSESLHAISWPNRWERDLWQWAMADDEIESWNAVDRHGIMDAEFHRTMRGLIQDCGGFLYRCEESRQIVFAPTAELPRIWDHQDHLAAIDRAKPFGFFGDMSRPNWREFGRELTEFEQGAFKTIERRSRPKAGRRRLFDRLRALFGAK